MESRQSGVGGTDRKNQKNRCAYARRHPAQPVHSRSFKPRETKLQVPWSQNYDTTEIPHCIQKADWTMQARHISLDTTGTTCTYILECVDERENISKAIMKNNSEKKKSKMSCHPEGDVVDNTKEAKEAIPI